MLRRTTIAAATIVLAALLFLGAASAAMGTPTPTGRRVVVVLAPYLTWDDVTSGMPQLRRVAGEGIMAEANIRSGSPNAGLLTAERTALMLSSGASAAWDPLSLAGHDSSETVGDTSARDLYAVLAGESAPPASVLFLGSARQRAFNTVELLETHVGALGDALHAAGVRTAALGNSDLRPLSPGVPPEGSVVSRPAAVAAADGAGIVDLGQVSGSLLITDAGAPFGVRTDPAGLSAAYSSALAGGARFLVVDSGDLARAAAVGSYATSQSAAAARTAAVAELDRLVGELDGSLGDDDLLVVLSSVQAARADGLQPSLSPVVLRGAGLGRGLGRAPSTRRDGVVTVMDLSATILDVLGAIKPADMVGSLASGSANAGDVPSFDSRIAFLTSMTGTTDAVEEVRGTVVNDFITITVVVLLLSTLLSSGWGAAAGVPARRVFRALLVFVLCIPLAALLAVGVLPRPPTGTGLVLVTVAGAAAAAAALLVSGRRRAVAWPLIGVTALTVFALLADQWAGAPLSFAGLFGYSIVYGARFYGIGNEMAGLLLGSAVVALALAADSYGPRVSDVTKRWAWPLTGLLVIGTAAAPPIGANIGCAVWMPVGFIVGWLMLSGRKVWTWKAAVAIAAVIVLVIVAFAVVDLSGGREGATHIGRALSPGEGGGLSTLGTMVARKAETNLRVLGRTNWTYLLIAVLLLLGYMRWRPQGNFRELLDEYPAFSAAVAAALFAGAVGWFTEDSGIIVPALVMLPVGVAALYLMLARSDTRSGGAA